MAKITKMPSMAIVNGFKGVIDFYVHDGQPCVRKWPRSPGHDRAPAVMEKWTAFAWAASNWNSLSPEIQEAYRRMASGTNLTGRDLFVKGYLTPLYIHLE